jgi:adenylosuccinate synthase
MKIDVLLGLQWGDEGKGKIVDVLTPKYDTIARFQGGPNAGHTLIFDGNKYVLHSIPSGIFNEDTVNVIGNGVVLDPVIFAEEIKDLNADIEELKTKLKISKKTHLIVPTHRILDAANEQAKGKSKIGSTLKGIGPTYMDKTGRNGLRVGDLISDNFKTKYEALKTKHAQMLENFDFEYDVTEYEQKWMEAVEFMKQFELIDSEHYFNNQLKDGKRILAEGAQGTLLDIDFGSYPFVTSSNTVCAGACTGMGVAPNKIGEVYGIFKAYCTRVGMGPFPSELFDEVGATIQDIGKEKGATTGRNRRCGWLDLVALKYSVIINGVTQLIMTKADVFNTFEKIKVVTAYKINGEETTEFPYDIDCEIDPVFKEFKGWQSDLTGLKEEKDFPQELNEYIAFLEKALEVPITIVSVGPDRNQTIIRK